MWLGKVQQRTAETWKCHIEELVAAQNEGRSPYNETSAWLGRLGDSHYAKLARVGLVPKRQGAEQTTLGPFLSSYISGRSDVKPGTLLMYEQVRGNLIERFGANKAVTDITPADADDWRRWLMRPKDKENRENSGQGLNENTARKRCAVAKQFFRAAVRRRLIVENPFADMAKLTVGANERKFFVTREMAKKVLDACPDAQWKLLFALSRYGGLRCPSEHLALRWSDVDLDRGRITVRSPKTEHHEGKSVRIIPLFPELRPYLEAVRKEADPGMDVPFSSPVITRYRHANANLRTQLERIIIKAGLTPWPSLFNSLRSTRETELVEQYPGHVVCKWIGHNQRTADKHYLQVTDDHYSAAVKWPTGNLQNPMQQAAATNAQGHATKNKSLEFAGNCEGLRYFAPCKVVREGLKVSKNHREKQGVPQMAAQNPAHCQTI